MNLAFITLNVQINFVSNSMFAKLNELKINFLFGYGDIGKHLKKLRSNSTQHCKFDFKSHVEINHSFDILVVDFLNFYIESSK